jgi:hypothetical protein
LARINGDLDRPERGERKKGTNKSGKPGIGKFKKKGKFTKSKRK